MTGSCKVKILSVTSVKDSSACRAGCRAQNGDENLIALSIIIKDYYYGLDAARL